MGAKERRGAGGLSVSAMGVPIVIRQRSSPWSHLANADAGGDEESKVDVKRYMVEGALHTRQYAQMYFVRLARARKRIMQEAASSSGKKEGNASAYGLRNENGSSNEACFRTLLQCADQGSMEKTSSVVIGTIYKEQRMKPNILNDYMKGSLLQGGTGNGYHSVGVMLEQMKLIDADTDTVIIEDESARMKLVMDDSIDKDDASLELHKLVTGVVVAACGYVNEEDGCFHATKISFVRPSPQGRPPNVNIDNSSRMEVDEENPESRDPHVVLVSGLDIGESDQLKVQLLMDFLTGNAGSEEDTKLCSSIVRVIVAGGTICLRESFRDAIKTENSSVPSNGNDTRESLKLKLREVDVVLSELASSIPIDIMPGEGEPTNHNLPQQPFHTMLLPGISQFLLGDDSEDNDSATIDTVRLSTNPHCFSEHGVSFIGTSGQNINDVYRYSSLEDRLDILTHTLLWGCIAPTAPDTLPCYPIANADVFEIDEWPDIYFSGMMNEFGSRLITLNHENNEICIKADDVANNEGQDRISRTRVICVPHFGKTGTVALVNLRTLECSPIIFDVSE